MIHEIQDHINFNTATLAKEKGFSEWDKCDSGYHPYDGSIIDCAWPALRRNYPVESLGRPIQSVLQAWLRGQNIIIDMFREDNLWSGRVYKLRDPEQRWQSTSTVVYEDTLEIMLFRGLQYL